MKKSALFFILFSSVILVACDKSGTENAGGYSASSGPSSEDLAQELQNTEKSADPVARKYKLNFKKKFGLQCYNMDSITKANNLGYELVVVIDKAAEGQTFKVYRNGKLIGDWLTSTGQELRKAVLTPRGNPTRKQTTIGFHTPIQGRLYGGFDRNGVEQVYKSKSYKGVPMPNAIFYTKGGEAIHQTNQVGLLGTRASGGCARLSPDVAPDFFNLVKFEVGRGETVALDEQGCVKRDSKGNPVIIKGYRTLIVIRDSSL